MAFDAFVKIEGIPGEALDENYRDWIEVSGYSFGTQQSTSGTDSSNGGASSGRTTLSNFTITKVLDKVLKMHHLQIWVQAKQSAAQIYQ